MNNFLAFIKKYKLPIFSGLIIGTSYIPFPPWGILFGYLPLWFWLIHKAKTAKEAFWAGWVCQFTLTAIGFHWITYTAKEYGQFPWPIAVLTFIAFCALAHLYIPILTFLFFKFKEKLKPSLLQSLLFLTLGHSLAEIFWPGIFPWHLGYTLLWVKFPIYHFADLIGFWGLSLLLLFFHLFLALVWFKPSETYKKIIYTSPYLLLFLALNLAGWTHGEKWESTDKKINILNVQANIGNLEKVYAEKGKFFRDEIVNKFITLSEVELQKNNSIDLVLWPESAIPEYLNLNYRQNKNQQKIANFLTKYNKPLLSGAFSKDDRNKDPDKSVFNALFLLDSQGKELSAPYHKTYLLAFGEYLPFSDTFPFLLKLLPFISNFGRGGGPQILTLPIDIKKNDYVLIGGQICYEGLYPEFSIGLAQKGAEIIVNVTNDSWFGIPFEPYQHLYMTLSRAIEIRRPLVRSTNTGISTAISAYGDIQELSPWHKEWAGLNSIPYRDNPPLTFYSQWGQYIWLVILIAFALNLLLSLYYEKSRKS
jgi:apolipoprotein N-acyltransferase